MASKKPNLEALSQELRRGALTLAVLGALRDEHYGYSLKSRLASKGLDVAEGTLYPLLRRLHAQGLLDSDWRTDTSRPRRYYYLSDAGLQALSEATREWNALVVATRLILNEV
jgi:PadR family transcriptional regulator, regulatory protein PadR